jgi:hypothetical protein
MLWTMAKYAAVIGGLMVAVLVVFYLIDEPGRPVNRAIFSVFRAIENRCMAERWPHETVRCKGALGQKEGCDRAWQQTGHACTPKEYYCTLEKLGFDLLPYWSDTGGHQSPCGSRWDWVAWW